MNSPPPGAAKRPYRVGEISQFPGGFANEFQSVSFNNYLADSIPCSATVEHGMAWQGKAIHRYTLKGMPTTSPAFMTAFD